MGGVLDAHRGDERPRRYLQHGRAATSLTTFRDVRNNLSHFIQASGRAVVGRPVWGLKTTANKY